MIVVSDALFLNLAAKIDDFKNNKSRFCILNTVFDADFQKSTKYIPEFLLIIKR